MIRLAGFGLMVVMGLSAGVRGSSILSWFSSADESDGKEARTDPVDQSLNQWWWNSNSNQASSGSNRAPSASWVGSSVEGSSLTESKPISVIPRRDPRMYYDERSATWRIFETTQLNAGIETGATSATPATTDDDFGMQTSDRRFFETAGKSALDDMDGVPMRSLFSPLFDETGDKQEDSETIEGTADDGLDGVPMRSLFSPLFDETEAEAAARRDHTDYTVDGDLDGVSMRGLFSSLFEDSVAEGKQEETVDMMSAVTQDLPPSTTTTTTNDDEMTLCREETTPPEADEGFFLDESREATLALNHEDEASSSRRAPRNRPRRHPTALKRIPLGRKATLSQVDDVLQALCRDNRYAKYSLEEMRGDLVWAAAELAGHYQVRVLKRTDDQLVVMRTRKDRLPVDRTEIEALLERDERASRDAGRLFNRLTGSSSNDKAESSEVGQETTVDASALLRSSGYADTLLGTDTFIIDDSTSRSPSPEQQLPPPPRIVDEFISPHHDIVEKPTPRRLRQRPPRPPRRQTPRRLFSSAQEELQEALRDHQEESIADTDDVDETIWESEFVMPNLRKSSSSKSVSFSSASPRVNEAPSDIFDNLSAAVDAAVESMANNNDDDATLEPLFETSFNALEPVVPTEEFVSEAIVPSLDVAPQSQFFVSAVDVVPSEPFIPSPEAVVSSAMITPSETVVSSEVSSEVVVPSEVVTSSEIPSEIVTPSEIPSVVITPSEIPSLDDPASAIHRQLVLRASTLHHRHHQHGRGGNIVGRVMMPRRPHPHHSQHFNYQQQYQQQQQHQGPKPRSPPHQQQQQRSYPYQQQPRSPYNIRSPHRSRFSPYHQYHHQRSPYRPYPQRSPLRNQVVGSQSPSSEQQLEREQQPESQPLPTFSSSSTSDASKEQSWWANFPSINADDFMSAVMNPSTWNFEKNNEDESKEEKKDEKKEEAEIIPELAVYSKPLRFTPERALDDDPSDVQKKDDQVEEIVATPSNPETIDEPIPELVPSVVAPSPAPSHPKTSGNQQRGHMNFYKRSGLRQRKNVPKRQKFEK